MRARTRLMLSYFIKMENKLVSKHFSFGNSFCQSLDIRFGVRFFSSFVFLFSVSNNTYKRSHWSVTIQMRFRNSGERISKVHMQSKSIKSLSSLAYAVPSLRMSAYGYREWQTSWSSREKSSENHSFFIAVLLHAVTFRMANCFSWETFV